MQALTFGVRATTITMYTHANTRNLDLNITNKSNIIFAQQRYLTLHNLLLANYQSPPLKSLYVPPFCQANLHDAK
jgi:hypothetical protein